MSFFFKQKTAYEILAWLEFRRVLFRSDHTQRHHHDTDNEEGAVFHHPEEETTRKAAQGAEDEVKGCGKSGLGERHSKAFHEQFGSGGVGSHVDSHVTHNA